MKDSIQIKIFLLISLILILLSYYPSFSGYFEFDDIPNIRDNMELNQISGLNPAEIWMAAWSSDSGTLRRPVPMLSIALQIATTGLDPYPMKIVNLLIHWITGLVLFLLSGYILKQLSATLKEQLTTNWISLFTGLIWLVHPLNLTNVSYIIQRMNSLASLFLALAIMLYAKERLRQQKETGQWMLTSLLILANWLLGLLSKENAILLPVYLFVTEYFIFKFKAFSLRDSIIIRRIFLLGMPMLTLSFLIIFWLSSESLLSGYQIRQFNMEERLLTEARILIWYLIMLVIPNINQMTLYHDGITISKSLLSPPETILSIIIIVILIIYALRSRKNYPWIGFGILWFFSGHLLESTILPLELAYEHRNYLPSFGIIFMLILSLKLTFTYQLKSRSPVIILLVLFVIFLTAATHTRAYIWSGSLKENIVDATNHPQSIRANIHAGNSFSIFAKYAKEENQKKIYMDQGEAYYKRALALNPNSINPYFGWIFMYYENRLYPPQQLLDELKSKISTSQVDATTINGLDSLTNCKIDKFCKFSDEEYLTIMEQAFDNKNTPTIYKSYILRNMSKFYSSARKEPKIAALMTKKAIELAPKIIGIRLELIDYLAQAGYLQEALDALNHLEKIDNLKQYQSIILKLRKQLEKALNLNSSTYKDIKNQ